MILSSACDFFLIFGAKILKPFVGDRRAGLSLIPQTYRLRLRLGVGLGLGLGL